MNKILPAFTFVIIALILLFAIMFTHDTKPQTPNTPIKATEPSRGGSRPRTITCEATAYCLTTPSYTGNETGIGMVACDPDFIPLGTYLYIEGYGEAQALDTGKDIKGNRIDVWLPTKDECLRWGSKQVEVTILKEGE